MVCLEAVYAIAGSGLEGDRYALGTGTYSKTKGGGREITLIEIEVIESLRREHGLALASGETRRNIVTRGLSLNVLVGRDVLIGDVLCRAIRLCEPCDYLAELLGKPLLRPLAHRGGLRTEVVTGGLIRRGDAIRLA
jgi:MOSC domain-containing protein YiiM